MQALWNGKVIAESSDTVVVESNHYFPLDRVRTEYLKASNTQTAKSRTAINALEISSPTIRVMRVSCTAAALDICGDGARRATIPSVFG